MHSLADHLNWMRSRICSSGACVEIANDGDHFYLRDSTVPTEVLVLSAEAGAAFLAAARTGELDLPAE